MIISDAGPIIIFARIGRLSLLRDITGSLLVPDAVYEEIVVKKGGISGAADVTLHVPVSRMYEITRRQRAITPETALRLARYLGTSAEFWLGLQSDYDLERAQEEFKERIEREVQPRERAA
jgi:antitoxin HigA-1